MNPPKHIRHPRLCLRIILWTMIAAMLANPVLAALPAFIGCNGGCCCCRMSALEPTPTLRSAVTAAADCCRPTGTTPCHMSGADPQNPPVVLVRNTDPTASETDMPLPASRHSSVGPAAGDLSTPWVDTGPHAPSTHVYLTTCRLIC